MHRIVLTALFKNTQIYPSLMQILSAVSVNSQAMMKATIYWSVVDVQLKYVTNEIYSTFHILI